MPVELEEGVPFRSMDTATVGLLLGVFTDGAVEPVGWSS
jgi:hypothetical protein